MLIRIRVRIRNTGRMYLRLDDLVDGTINEFLFQADSYQDPLILTLTSGSCGTRPSSFTSGSDWGFLVCWLLFCTVGFSLYLKLTKSCILIFLKDIITESLTDCMKEKGFRLCDGMSSCSRFSRAKKDIRIMSQKTLFLLSFDQETFKCWTFSRKSWSSRFDGKFSQISSQILVFKLQLKLYLKNARIMSTVVWKDYLCQDIDLTLPGWGEWGGGGLKPSKRKRKRFIIKAPPPEKRRDENKGINGT